MRSELMGHANTAALLRRQLADPAVHSVAIQMFGAVAAFFVYLIITRAFGAEQSGEYALFVQTVVAGSAVGLFGYDQKVMRSIARATSAGSTRDASDHLRDLGRRVGPFVIAVSMVAAALAAALGRFGGTVPLPWMVAPAIAGYACLRFVSAALRGAGALRLSQGLVSTQALVMLALTAVLVSWQRDEPPDISATLILYAISIVGPLAVGAAILRQRTRSWSTAQPVAAYEPLDDRDHALGLSVLIPTVATWLSFAGLASAIGSQEVAAYQACILLVTPVNMARTTYLTAVAPELTTALALGDQRRVGALRRRHRQVLLSFGAPPLVLLGLFSEPALAIFDESLTNATGALRVFVLGMLMNLVFGSASTTLLMMGEDRRFLSITLQALTIWGLVLLATISALGVLGVAIAYSLQILHTQARAWLAVDLGSRTGTERVP